MDTDIKVNKAEIIKNIIKEMQKKKDAWIISKLRECGYKQTERALLRFVRKHGNIVMNSERPATHFFSIDDKVLFKWKEEIIRNGNNVKFNIIDVE